MKKHDGESIAKEWKLGKMPHLCGRREEELKQEIRRHESVGENTKYNFTGIEGRKF